MRTVLLVFFYLLCCEATGSFSKMIRVILGKNVTLDCSLNNKDIYWLFLKPPDALVVILRTFSSETASAMYNDQRFQNKYSSLTLSRLFISNVTIDELGIYYCVKPASESKLQLSNGTKLYITETALQNQTENDRKQHMQQNTAITHSALTVTSVSLNVVLFITIIALLMLKRERQRESPNPSQNVEAEPFEDLNMAEYSEIELPTYSREAEPSQISGTYTLLQKPKLNAKRSQT